MTNKILIFKEMQQKEGIKCFKGKSMIKQR